MKEQCSHTNHGKTHVMLTIFLAFQGRHSKTHLTKEMDNQLLQLRMEYQQPSQSPLSLTSDSWDPYMLHEELKLFMAAPGKSCNAISWKGFTNFKTLWIFVIYQSILKNQLPAIHGNVPSFQAIQHCIWSNLTWSERWKGDTPHSPWCENGCLPKSRPIAKGFDAILLHCHLRCDFVFACSAQVFLRNACTICMVSIWDMRS